MIVLILLCVMLGGLWLYRRKQVNVDAPPALPGGWPVLGHVSLLTGDSCHLWRSVCDVTNKCYSLGGVVSVTIGPRTVYVVTDPDDALTVANSCLQKDRFYDFAKPWLGNGLATGHYSVWKNNRKLLQPAFSPIVLDGFLGVFNSQSRKLVDDLKPEVGKGLFDHWNYTKRNALETICLTALGVDIRDHTTLNNQYVEAIDDIFCTMVDRFQKFWLHHPLMYKYSSLKKKHDDCLKILQVMSDTVLNRKKITLNNKAILEANHKECPGSKIKFKAYMDLLLDLSLEKGVFNDKEIREHVDTMIVGGHDTVANVLMFTLLLLGSHADVQEKAYNELQDVFGGSDRDVEKADLSKLVYLEAVLKESMRIHTIAPVTARWLHRNVKLKNCTLSARRTCFIFVFGLHRHSVWGADVDRFRPERWLDPNTLPETPNAYAAFMIGRRMCIGKTFAYMSMKITLSHLIRRYKIHADDSNLVLKLDVMLKPASGYFISIEDRKNC